MISVEDEMKMKGRNIEWREKFLHMRDFEEFKNQSHPLVNSLAPWSAFAA